MEERKLQSDNLYFAIIVALIASVFLTTTNMTAFNILLPGYMILFQTDMVIGQWLSIGYTLTCSMTILVAGYFSDKYSAKKVLLSGLTIMAVCSILSCFATDIYSLIVFRMIMGCGAGLTSAVGATIIYQSLEQEKQMGAISMLTMSFGLGVAFGPTIAGALQVFLGWRCIYIFNIVMALIVMLLVMKNVPVFIVNKDVKADFFGLIIGMIGTTLIIYSFTKFNEWGILSLKFIGYLFVGLASVLYFLYRQTKVAFPCLNLSILKNKQFLNAAVIFGISTIALILSPFAMSMYFQNVLGYSALVAGEMIILPSLALSLGSAIVGKTIKSGNERPFVIAGYCTLVIATFMLSKLTPTTSLIYIMVWLTIRYFCIGVTDPLIANYAFSTIPKELMGHASSFKGWLRQMFNAIGLSIFTVLMNAKATAYISAGMTAANGLCKAIADVTLYSMVIVIICVPLVCLLKTKKS